MTPDDPSRRRLLAAMAGGAGVVGLMAAPTAASGAAAGWAEVRDRFPLRAGLIHLNSANLAPASRAVLEAERAASASVNADPSFENRLHYEAGAEATRTALAGMLGASPDEIAITRNTSEGNRTVIDGLQLGPSDEVVIWDQNHESNNVAWDVWARRQGFTVVRVRTPSEVGDPDELVAAFGARMGPRTRLLAFSHVSNQTGLALPAQALCRAAAERGVLTLVDGAQTFGMMNLDLHAIGCDFYTGSGHKWLCGPHETGVLYVRRERIEGLWPSMVTHGWEARAAAGARKFDCLGQRQDGRVEALRAAVRLQDELGRPQIEARIRQLVANLRDGLKQSGAPLRFVNPAAPALSAGIVTFRIDAPNPRQVMRTLYEGFGVSAVASPVTGGSLVRFSPNIYIGSRDVEVAVAAAAKAARQG